MTASLFHKHLKAIESQVKFLNNEERDDVVQVFFDRTLTSKTELTLKISSAFRIRMKKIKMTYTCK